MSDMTLLIFLFYHNLLLKISLFHLQVVALVTYLAILVPRAHLLAEAITQGIFMAAMYQLFCLFVAYCGGEAELIRKVKPEAVNMRVGPCCCWPCCCCLPQLNLTK